MFFTMSMIDNNDLSLLVSKEMKSLKKEMEELQKELDSLYDRDRAHVTPRAQSAQSAVARRRSPSVSGSTPRKTGK